MSAEVRSSARKLAITSAHVVTENDFSFVSRYVHDLSEHGMFVASDREVPLGSNVIISLRVPGTAHWIDLSGEITRRVRGTRKEDLGQGYGVRFWGARRSDRAVLRASLKRLPRTKQRAATRRNYAHQVAQVVSTAADPELTFNLLKAL